MDKLNLTISKIETYLYSLINNKVSENTFVSTPPETMKSSWSDLCVIDCGSAITDLDGYGGGVIRILLYARPMADGSKNVSTLASLDKKLMNVLTNIYNKTYQLNRRDTYPDYDTERKWHYNVVEFNLMIF